MHVATIEVRLQLEKVYDLDDAVVAEAQAAELVDRIQDKIETNQLGWLNRLEVVDSCVEIHHITTY